MTEEFQLNDDTYTGTKEVSENLKFESKLLQEWINDNVKDSGNIEKIEQFKGGQSNPTYKISTENNAYVLRRKPPGKLLPKAHAVDREYKVITALYETDVPVPKTYGLCEDDSVVGTPFFLMEYVDGTVYWDHMLPKCCKRVSKCWPNRLQRLTRLTKKNWQKTCPKFSRIWTTLGPTVSQHLANTHNFFAAPKNRTSAASARVSL